MLVRSWNHRPPRGNLAMTTAHTGTASFMKTRAAKQHASKWMPGCAAVGLLALACSLGACSKADDAAKAANPTPAAAPTAAPVTPPEPIGPPPPPTADAKTWTPAALDELLAPIALYPDPLIAQILAGSTDPQQVLDAGNWLLDHQDLKGDDLTKAAADAGFTPTTQALVHFPTVMDMMCRELDWTKQVGAAFGADQAAVLASIQRLRAQAAAVGNLKTSPEMTVTKTEQNGQSVIVVQPPSPQVVYVPQYNPQTVYTQAPAAAPATTTTTTTTESGISTETAVVGGLLAFGAGMLIGNAIADNHDDDYYGYPAWGYGGVYYGGHPYPPYPPYRPAYPGYRPTPYYRAPGNYGNRYNNYNRNGNTNINIDNSRNNYFNRFDGNRNRASTYQARSPINSPPATDRAANRGSASYAGADRAANRGSTSYAGADRPRPTTQPANRPSTSQGGYAGANRPSQGASPSGTYRGNEQGGRPSAAQRPSTGVDRGYQGTSGNRTDAGATNARGGSFSGVNQGSRDRAASERGRSSMQGAARPSSTQRASRGGGGRGGGGGGGGGGRGGRG